VQQAPTLCGSLSPGSRSSNPIAEQAIVHLNYNVINPFTPSSGQSKNSRKMTIFSFSNPAKQIVPCDSTVKEISFE